MQQVCIPGHLPHGGGAGVIHCAELNTMQFSCIFGLFVCLNNIPASFAW